MEFEATDSEGKSGSRCDAYPSNGGISVFFHDITERKRAEEERLTTSKLESLGTLAGGIAHDLNNILTVISGQHRAGADWKLRARAAACSSFLSKAGQAAQHAAHLSSQLLTFSKGGAPVKKVVSVVAVARTIGGIFALRVEHPRLTSISERIFGKRKSTRGKSSRWSTRSWSMRAKPCLHGGTVRVRGS